MPEQTDPAPGQGVTSYFRPLQGYFWRWAESNEVVEWVNGTTITYREELAALLTGLAPTGLPRLGPALLLLAACSSTWQSSRAETGLLQGLLRSLPPGGPPDEELTFHLSVARSFWDIIRELPTELRQGVAKEHLLRLVLGDTLPRSIAVVQVKELANDLANFFQSELIQPRAQLTRWQFREDLLFFDQAARKFRTVHSLELRLRTGLDQLPEPLEEAPAPPPAPPTGPALDLLAELAQNQQTAGLARLVPHLRAALHLPHPAPQASEQPLGGVADLSNRGPLHRLLLSELAQDDLSLLARLAHGEALYLRREAPPLPQPPTRVLLLDITLPMWGLPRVAGLAAALALAQPAGPEPPAAFAVWSHHLQRLDLRSRAGVVATLGLLDPALHCGEALRAMRAILPARAEALLITEAQAARQPEFRAALAAAPAALRFLLTIARSGELVLYEVKAGHRTVLSTSQVDLELLLNPPGRKTVKSPKSVQRPAFLRQPKAPLLFPAMRAGLQLATLCQHEGLGTAAVTNDRRLLYWPASGRGAQELLPAVEEGVIHLSIDDSFDPDADTPAGRLHLLLEQRPANQAPRLLFYAISLPGLKTCYTDLSGHPALAAGWAGLRYAGDGCLALETPAAPQAFECFNQSFDQLDEPHREVARPGVPADFLQTSYEVLSTLPHIGLSSTGKLMLGNYLLVAEASGILKLQPLGPNTQLRNKRTQPQLVESQQLISNKSVDFQRFVWPNGSEAFVDSRGLLHLRSATKKLPEVTLVLVADWPTAAWAADGKRCGFSYFTGIEPQLDEQALLVPDFYAAYIQPFINQIC
ncbi:hypothetical protein QMK33_05740 [Hymenobacter sp. H14-R3]|uniref:hypothetical protein n=1 Tax=Hymenobacter sp. H14-R3 TaxID=3046308 RepID=UPI0024B9F1C3|nr:hypothetical protein [Hymenobacter sp. H14-R3]MDJ0364647.1 hypothetical protein [Hymenobacter sp. H14-R3]